MLMNSVNSKTSDAQRLRLNLRGKWVYREVITMFNYSNVVSTTNRKISKSSAKRISLKYQEQHGMKTFNFLVDIFCIRNSRLF